MTYPYCTFCGTPTAEHPEPLCSPDDTWTVAIRIPISLPDEARSGLYKAVADAAHAWEPDERDGWDAVVSCYPTAQFDAEVERLTDHDELRDQVRYTLGSPPDLNMFPHASDALVDAVMEIFTEEALDRMANKLLEETNLRAMDFRNGMSMEIEPARALAANFVGAARAMLGEAPNYSETPIEMTTSLAADPDNPASWEKFAFIVQRIAPGKLTPHEARMAAEKRADEAETELDRLRDLMQHLPDAHATLKVIGESEPVCADWCYACFKEKATALLETALHIRVHGENAPGGGENWAGWERDAEAFLRGIDERTAP